MKAEFLHLNISAITTPPTLETERMILKPVTGELRNYVFQGLGDGEVRRRMKMPVLDTEEKQQEWWQRFAKWRSEARAVQWCAFTKEKNEYVSLLTIKEIDHHNMRGELGYSVLKKAWRRGYGAEGVARLTTYAFEEIGLHTLFAIILPYNVPSVQIVKGMGFEQEAYFRELHRYEGEFYDVLQFSKINPKHPG